MRIIVRDAMKSFFRSIAYIIPLLLITGIFIINFDEILKKMPKGADYLAPLTQGIALNRKGQYDQAISCFNEALEINPKIYATYYGRGLAYHNKGQYDKAISDWTMAIEINPKYTEAYNNRGRAYAAKGRYDKACSDWRRACDLWAYGDCELAIRKGVCK
jgi:tetratricopeptide (TPR) repeat protein